MYFYVVRHGQTVSNKERRYQTPDTPLSLNGEEQAAKLADRLKDIALNEIWTSPLLRATSTADVINAYHHIPIVKVNDLQEIKRSIFLEGKLPDDPSIIEIQREMDAHAKDPYYKYGEGESFADLVKRSQKFVEFASERATQEQQIEPTVCVVTHGVILATIVMCILLGPNAPVEQVGLAAEQLHIENTGLSLFRCVDHKWRIITFNDFAHL